MELLAIDGNYHNLELVKTWSILSDKLDLIYDEDECVNFQFLMDCYGEVFDYAMYVNKENIQSRFMGKQEITPGKTLIVLRDLYMVLIIYIDEQAEAFANRFSDVSDSDVFNLYAVEWRKFRAIHKKVQCVFQYLDRSYVPNERKEISVNRVYEVYQFALIKWHDKVFNNHQKRLIPEFTKLFNSERDGRQIDKALVSLASKSFLELGTVHDDDQLRYYKSLETAFLSSTEDYFRERSRKYMIEINVFKSMTFEDYMTEISATLSNEALLIKTYLDESSTSAVMKICEECFIKEHVEAFNTALSRYLEGDERHNIARLYELVSIFPDSLEIFTSNLKEHIEKEAINEINEIDVLNVDPKVYIETLLKVFIKYESLIQNELKNDEKFKVSLQSATTNYVNNNIVVEASLISRKDPNAELLAKYCDILLSMDSGVRLTEPELEKALLYVVVFVKMIVDKTSFRNFYENISAPRMICKNSVSDEMEDFMILRLEECFAGLRRRYNTDALNFSALKGISENMKTSEDISSEFKSVVEIEKDSKVCRNFSVSLIPDRHWQSGPHIQAIKYLPTLPVFDATIERFTKFYKNKFSGTQFPKKGEECNRKIVWLHYVGKGELNADFSGKRFVFMTGALQMAILMPFNDQDSYLFVELRRRAGATTTPDRLLHKTLAKLFEMKILLCSGDYESLQNDTRISLNLKFENKNVRIKLDHSIKFEEEVHRSEVHQRTVADHEVLSILAVVRIVKREKRVSRNDLIGLLLEELKNLFKPEVEMLKRAISECVAKSNISIDGTDTNFYVYND